MRCLRPGLRARLELDAFPREDFGHVECTVVEVEPDADTTGNYTAWMDLERERDLGLSLMHQLKPGLLGEARIIIERRRVADFLLKPLKRLGSSLREVE